MSASTPRFRPVTFCDLTKAHGDPRRTIHLAHPDELLPLLDGQATELGDIRGADHRQNTCGLGTPTVQPRVKSDTGPNEFPGRIVFLKGFASAEWLNHLGAFLDIDPEFFHRHLSVSSGLLPHGLQPDRSYSTPAPRSQDLIQLRVCNPGSWAPKKSGLRLETLREECRSSMAIHLGNFARLHNFSIGDSIVRRFMLHDLFSFSVEQSISIEVIYHTTTWSSESGAQEHRARS